MAEDFPRYFETPPDSRFPLGMRCLRCGYVPEIFFACDAEADLRFCIGCLTELTFGDGIVSDQMEVVSARAGCPENLPFPD